MRNDDNECLRISQNVDADGCSETNMRHLVHQTKRLEKTGEVGDKLDAKRRRNTWHHHVDAALDEASGH